MFLIRLVTLGFIIGGCSALYRSPERFKEFAEHQIAGPGSYELPQWSPNSRYIAYIEGSQTLTLAIYDTVTGLSWQVAASISSAHFSWKSDSSLTYLIYRLDLSGSPYPAVYDLHQVDLDGNNDRIIATNLSSPRDFTWFADGTHLAIVLKEASSRDNVTDLYLLNTETNIATRLLDAQSIGFNYIGMVALSKDENVLLLAGATESDPEPLRYQIILYDLANQNVLKRFSPSQVIDPQNTEYPWPTLRYRSNSDWVSGKQWFLGNTNTASGDCYNYAIYFFDTSNLSNSFCIPTEHGIVTDAVMAPDLSKISYITVVGPGQTYLMVSDIPSELRERLQLNHE